MFTSEARYGVVIRLAAGGSLVDACGELGLSEATVKGWLTRGRRETSGEYSAFAVAVEQARQVWASRPEAMTEAELAVAVSERAREGVVSAMELRWKMLTKPADEQAQPVAGDPLAEVDELARRRQH